MVCKAMTAQGVIISYIEAEDLGYQSEWIAALTHQSLNGIIDAYRHDVHAVRNFQEQINVAARMRDWLEGSTLTTRQAEIVYKMHIHCVVYHNPWREFSSIQLC